MVQKGNLNRLKVVLCEKGKTSKWLSQQLCVNPSTVSKWCSNKVQPDLHTISMIALLLDVDQREILCSTK